MVTTTRITSSLPGTTGRFWYGDAHDEHMFLWRSVNPRPNTPVLVYCKPGHMFNQGERVMDPHTSSSPALGVAIDTLYATYDWPIIGIEFRPPHSADSPRREPFDNRPWPGPVLSAGKAVAAIRENWNNQDWWGSGASIDPGRVAFLGSSSGHTMGLLLACIPPGRLPIPTTNGLGQRPFMQDHRPDAVCGFIGQIDWTQWVLDPSAASGPFAYDVHQYFFGLQSALTYSRLANSIKKSASPWWWLPFLEPKRTAFWGSWGTRPGSGSGRNLTPELWTPGTPWNQNANGRAFIDPHHYFQAKPWDTALRAAGATVYTIWGSDSDNLGNPNNDNVGLNSTTTADDLVRFLGLRLRWGG